MYRIPKELDLSAVVGEFTTQVRVGQFDLQFTIGPVNFAIHSPVSLVRRGVVVATWAKGKWPDSGFFDVLNSDVKRCEIVNDRLIVLEFENDLEMHLEDSSDQYECMQISIEGTSIQWII
jgi:hypothetical protein